PAPGEPAAPPEAAPAPEAAPDMPAEPLAFDPGQSLAGLGSSFAASDTPNMIGDLFSIGGANRAFFGPPERAGGGETFFTATGITGTPKFIPEPSASLVGLQRIAENNSPIPRHRVFVNYSYFDDTPLSRDGIDVHRVTPGFEQTYLEDQVSIEARFPFAHTLDSDLRGRVADDTKWEFGNIMLALKALIHESHHSAASVGLALSLPSADDLRMFGRDEEGRKREVVRIRNEAVLLMPFAGFVATDPGGRCFVQGFVQGVFDTEDQSVLILTESNRLVRAGSIDPPNLVLGDIGVGYWLHRDECSGSPIKGVAPTVEVHWARSLEETDSVLGGPLGNTVRIGEHRQTFETVNLVLGTTFLLGRSQTLAVGFAAPLTDDSDKQFDYEVRVLFNCYFDGRPGGNGSGFYR
ncbi:MAG TPA: hypothetical protein VML55_19765, partial [Planctomycetaceae bacterium]|nr:hypothetical protein [Planctomycetaceae bacterium]